MKKLLLGIAGGSGSGKTSLAKAIAEEIGGERALLVSVDSYYKDLSALPAEARSRVNFDNPDAIDWPLLRRHIKSLLANRKVKMPVYSFAEHVRSGHTTVEPRDVIIIEGIFALIDDRLCDLMGMRIFVETPSDIRLARRIERDVADRGRTLQSVLDQWHRAVRPAHEAFIGPSARRAHIIIPEDPEGGMREIAATFLQSTIKEFYTGRKITHLHGEEGVKQVFRDILSEGKPNFVLDSEGQFAHHMPEFSEWFSAEVKKRNIPIKLVTRKQNKEKSPSVSAMRFIRKRARSRAVINIYADKVAIVVWGKVPEAVVIHDNTVASSLRNYFDVLWKAAEEEPKCLRPLSGRDH